MRGFIQFLVLEKIACLMIIVVTDVLFVGQYAFLETVIEWSNFLFPFSLLSEQSRNNRSQYFSNVAQVNLINLSV